MPLRASASPRETFFFFWMGRCTILQTCADCPLTVGQHSPSADHPPVAAPSVLVIDPSPAAADAVREAVGARAEVRAAATLSAGLEQLRAGGWAAVVLSVDLPAADLVLV